MPTFVVLPKSQDTIARATESETDAETLMERQSTRTEEQIKTKAGEAARRLRVMAQAAEEKLAIKQAEVDRRLHVLGEETQVRAQTSFCAVFCSCSNWLVSPFGILTCGPTNSWFPRSGG